MAEQCDGDIETPSFAGDDSAVREFIQNCQVVLVIETEHFLALAG